VASLPAALPAAEARDVTTLTGTTAGGVGLLAGNDQPAPATPAEASATDPWRPSDWGLDTDRPQAVARQDGDADARWAEVLAERDSGAWHVLPGNTPPGNTPSSGMPSGDAPSGSTSSWDEPSGSTPSGDASSWDAPFGSTQPASTRARDTVPGDTPARANGGWSAGPGDGWGTGPSGDWGTGPVTSRGTDPGSDWGAGLHTGWNSTPETRQQPPLPASGQPWEPLTSTAGEPADEREAGSRAAGRKPAERHSHRAGRHGRPARRIWGRTDKDKDGES